MPAPARCPDSLPENLVHHRAWNARVGAGGAFRDRRLLSITKHSRTTGRIVRRKNAWGVQHDDCGSGQCINLPNVKVGRCMVLGWPAGLACFARSAQLP